MDFKFKSPLKAVLMRRLAFESFVAGRHFDFAEICSEHLPAARHELGLSPHEFSESAANAFLGGLLKPPKQLRRYGGGVRPVESWRGQWRLHYVPPHDEVRRLSMNPAVKNETYRSAALRKWTVTFRGSAVPKLTVITGPLDAMQQACDGHCGVYLLHRGDGLYIGQSTLPSNRFSQHLGEGQPLWTVFVAPEDSDRVDHEVLRVAEALLISFWGEVAMLANDSGGSLQKPRSEHRQQGVLLAKGAAAALLWLRHKIDLGLPALDIPFRKWPVQGWPECYLEPQEKPIVGDHGEWPKDAWDLIFGGEAGGEDDVIEEEDQDEE